MCFVLKISYLINILVKKRLIFGERDYSNILNIPTKIHSKHKSKVWTENFKEIKN